MILVNYKRGYNNKFDCSIHGTIKMTYREWDKVYHFLFRTLLKNIDLPENGFLSDMLNKDVKRAIETKDGFYINIRVTLTEMLVKKYKLNNYRRGNYQIYVSNKNIF